MINPAEQPSLADVLDRLAALEGEIQRLRTDNATFHQVQARLHEELARTQQENAHLQQENTTLHEQLAEALRAAKRQAAPFARRNCIPSSQKPGRKPGQGHLASLPRPTTELVTETKAAPLVSIIWTPCT